MRREELVHIPAPVAQRETPLLGPPALVGRVALVCLKPVLDWALVTAKPW